MGVMRVFCSLSAVGLIVLKITGIHLNFLTVPVTFIKSHLLYYSTLLQFFNAFSFFVFIYQLRGIKEEPAQISLHEYEQVILNILIQVTLTYYYIVLFH